MNTERQRGESTVHVRFHSHTYTVGKTAQCVNITVVSGMSEKVKPDIMSVQLPLSQTCCVFLGWGTQRTLWAGVCSRRDIKCCMAAADLSAVGLLPQGTQV